MLKHLDLFSGIGGFALGLQRTGGLETVGFCEIDKFCQKVLRKHWPDVPIYDDIRQLFVANAESNQSNWERSGGLSPKSAQRSEEQKIDIITGGYPCQPFSVAGKRRGHEDERHLWPEMFRVIQAVRPRWVIAENVAGHIQLGLDTVIAQMEAENYACWTFVVPACAVGAPHRRDRVWIVAYATCERTVREPTDIHQKDGRPFNALPWQFVGTSNVADTGCKFMESPKSKPRQERTKGNASVRTLFTNENRQTEQWWTTEPNVGRTLDGLPSWLDRSVGRGMSYAESCRAIQELRELWSLNVSKALRRTIGGFDRVQQAEVLFSFLREYKAGSNEARLLVEGAEASEEFLRGLRVHAETPGASHRSRQNEQCAGEHPDAMQALPRLLAYDGEEDWAGNGWEDAIPRVAHGVPNRVDRLKSLGNSIVPQIAEFIGLAILGHEHDH